MSRISGAFLVLIVLALCTAPPSAYAEDAWYKVRPGDYLFRIAQRFDVTVAQLKRDNGLLDDVIHPEQRLRISNPFTRVAAENLAWRHPFDGRPGETLRPFGDIKDGPVTTRHSGIDMACPRGTRVVAPANGVVRYLGVQDGYGLLMILDHGAGYVTLFGPFSEDDVYVENRQMISRGDGLGLTGAPVETSQSYLHIELRRDNEAVDPARLLR